MAAGQLWYWIKEWTGRNAFFDLKLLQFVQICLHSPTKVIKRFIRMYRLYPQCKASKKTAAACLMYRLYPQCKASNKQLLPASFRLFWPWRLKRFIYPSSCWFSPDYMALYLRRHNLSVYGSLKPKTKNMWIISEDDDIRCGCSQWLQLAACLLFSLQYPSTSCGELQIERVF
jgi:hypothetical protein